MERQTKHSEPDQHESVKQKYDEVQSDGRYEEGMARMALYHHHCQDPVIFGTLGDIRGKSLLDLACGNGFYTRRFRTECAADPVMGIEYRVGDVLALNLDCRFDIVTAIHLLHYLKNAAEIESVLRRIYRTLRDGGHFVTMIANPEFDLGKHNPTDSKTKFGYYFSVAEPGNGGLLRFHPGGFTKDRELTFECRRWEKGFINGIAGDVGFTAEWHDPFISARGLKEYGPSFFENYVANPQSKLLRLTKGM